MSLRRYLRSALVALAAFPPLALSQTVGSPGAERGTGAVPCTTGEAVVQKQCLDARRADLMTGQFERSYIVPFPYIKNGDRLWFEGNIAPPFYLIDPGSRVAIVVTPKVVLRMFRDESAPVRTPSYMPRVTAYFFPTLSDDDVRNGVATYVSLTLSHHSNGQEGPAFSPDGTVNFKDGSFSTNFFELAYGSQFATLDEAQSRLSVEWHPKAFRDALSTHQYSPLRFRTAATVPFHNRHAPKECITALKRINPFNCFSGGSLSYNVAYLYGDVEPAFHGKGRFPLSVSLSGTPTFSADISIFVGGYWGQDYYNHYYHRSLSTMRVGIEAVRGLLGGRS